MAVYLRPWFLSIKKLKKGLKTLVRNNAAGEYYLTDLVSYAQRTKNKVGSYSIEQEEVLGANNKHELSELYKAMVALNIRAAKQKGTIFKDEDTKEYRGGKLKTLDRFTMSFTSETYSKLVINDPVTLRKVTYNCRDETTFDERIHNLYCQESTNIGPFTFLFSLEKRRFTWFRGSLYGYPTDDGDTSTLTIGTCENF